MKRTNKKIIIGLLSLLFLISLSVNLPVKAEDNVWDANTNSNNKFIDLDAPVTEENVLALLDSYCPDGAYILRQTMSENSFLCWWSSDSKIISSLNTAVHEQCHLYTNGFNDETIYIGNGKKIQVEFTDVYRSKEMAVTIPEELRTFRYDPYIGNPTENLSSDVQGIYGLLNEFTAYCWGMNTGISLYPYYKNFGDNTDVWRQYINDGANGCQAYAEFQYFIFNYLKYAKEKYPVIYNGIINNKNFIAAYQQIERRYQSQINQYENSVGDLVQYLQKLGHSTKYSNGMLYIDNCGFGVPKNEYNNLIKELKSPQYDEIKNILGAEISLEEIQDIDSPKDNDSERYNFKRKVKKIDLSGISNQIAAGKKILLKANVKPYNAKNKKLRWSSSDPKIARVNRNGLVMIQKKTGGKTVVITAKATDGSGVKATYKIKSMKGVVKKVTITGAKKRKVKAGKKLKLKAKVTATKGSNKKLIWTSNNTKYATVSASGKVKTKKLGKGKKVKITAMATDGSNKKMTVNIKLK